MSEPTKQMKTCSKECVPACDFCRMFNYNGEHGVYVHRGYCVLHERKRDPTEVCDDFICGNYKVEGDNE